MFTPQQIDQISFATQTFGGYDKQAVDELLEPLTEDYVTLYKENALLKSKMRVLVSKLEEYRRNEASMKDAIVNAQKTCDLMVKEAESKCAQMLNDANQAATENSRNAKVLIEEENARVEDARRAATAKIDALQEQLRGCISALEQIKVENRPATPKNVAFDFDKVESASDAVADEISSHLEDLVGTAEELAPKLEPKHPASDTSARFKDLDKQFGKNYDPTH